MTEDHALCGKVQSDLKQSNLRPPEMKRRPYTPPMKFLRPALSFSALYLFALAVAGIIWGRFRKKQIWESAVFTGGQFVMSGLVAVATAGALTNFILKRTSDAGFLTWSGAALWIFLLFLIEIIAFTALQAARDWLKR